MATRSINRGRQFGFARRTPARAESASPTGLRRRRRPASGALGSVRLAGSAGGRGLGFAAGGGELAPPVLPVLGGVAGVPRVAPFGPALGALAGAALPLGTAGALDWPGGSPSVAAGSILISVISVRLKRISPCFPTSVTNSGVSATTFPSNRAPFFRVIESARRGFGKSSTISEKKGAESFMVLPSSQIRPAFIPRPGKSEIGW